MRNGGRIREGGPLPLEARRILWQRLWDQLLAFSPEASEWSAGQRGETGDEGIGDRLSVEEGR